MISPRTKLSATRRVVALATGVALAASLAVACGNDSDSGGSAQEQQAAENPPADPELVNDVQGRYFDDPEQAVVAADDEAAQVAAAHYAVENGIPFLPVDALAESSVSQVTTFGSVDAEALGDAEVTEGEMTEEHPVESVYQDIAEKDTDAESSFTLLATENTPLYDVASARAAGAPVEILPVGDPRATSESIAAVEAGNVLAAGPDFGSAEDFNERVELAGNGELPGGGGLVFPGRRMIALYGHPSGPALGVMGEQDPEAAVDRVNKLVEEYQQYSDQKIIPAFEIIATVASDAPGPDGDYSNEADPAELEPYIDAIVDAGGYAFLDLQPGRASLLDQAKIYEDLLKRPNVGLALDPEWKIGPDEQPMTNIGHVEAHEVDEVADWLAQLVRDNNIPQKGLILHQFQLQMIRDREQINTDHPELSFILHADGHGPTDVKMDTWNVMQQDLSDDYFMAWKNFIDEDTPMLNPEQTYSVEPRPWFVSYQ